MTAAAHRRATLCYLALVLILGGASAAGFGANLVLQVIGALLLIWSMRLCPPRLGWFAAAVGLLAIVQFVPLPPALWPRLPGREEVAHGFALLNFELPWLPLSLAPHRSLASLVWWIPALSLFLAARAQGADVTRPAARTIVGVAAVSAILGIAQWLRGVGYLYAVTNYGKAPGFFANSNHQSLFLLVALLLCIEDLLRPGGALRAAPARTQALIRYLAIALFVIGIAVNGSLAVLVLLAPACAALGWMVYRDRRGAASILLAGGVAIGGCTAAAVVLDILPNDLFGAANVAGIGRHAFWATTMRMIGDFAPTGSGLGTFEAIYHWYENPAMVGTTYVNHAHNDLFELLAETGVFGAAALAAFFAWLLPVVRRVMAARHGSTLPLAAIVVVLVVLLHSLVDYPLRTAAISGAMAVFCAVLGTAAGQAREDASCR